MADETGEEFKPRGMGIVRTAGTLYRQAWRVTDAFQKLPDEGAALADLPAYCVLERSPLEVPETAQEKRLRAAWDALVSVRKPTAETLAALLIVLIETVFEDAARPPGPLPFSETAARTVRPTAAHPRAYRGTKYRPPRGNAPEAIDLRHYLCDRAAVEDLLMRHAPFWDDALAILSRHGYETPETASHACDPYSACNIGCRREILTPGLDPIFRTVLLPNLRGRPWSDVERLRNIFFRLRLADSPDLLACVAALTAEAPTLPCAMAWCDFLATLPENERAAFAGLLVKTGAARIDPASLPADFPEIVTELSTGADSAYRIHCLLNTAAMEGDCRYLRSGFRLSDLRGRKDRREVWGTDAKDCDFPDETARQILAHITADNDHEAWRVFQLWKACAVLDGFGAFLASHDWTGWAPGVTCELLAVFSGPAHESGDDDTALRWHRLRAGADFIEAQLEATPPDYRWKFCANLNDFISFMGAADVTERSIPDACAYLARICRPPFHRRRNNAFVWVDFLAYLSRAQIDALLNAPDASFARLEKACARSNDERHIGWGTWALAKAAPALALGGFLRAPSLFFRTARTLGCLPRDERLHFVNLYQQEPMTGVDTDLLDDGDAYAFIREFGPAAVPKPLRAHYEEGAPLNKPRLIHYHQGMRRQWIRACLERLEEGAVERLSRGFALEEIDERARHALRIQKGARENRKALRKFLAAHWAGREDYLAAHPLTQAWLKKHPGLNLDLWTSGICLAGEAFPHGRVTIALERDPLEALKLGTYVGSCLGLGGVLEYSAAATVLDINKQVLYARDSSGAVIGRQVTAYSEAGELVCFSVYPYKDDNSLHPLFAEYDRRFAAALGVPLFIPSEDGQDDDYAIACILSHGWWDDGAWSGAATSLTRGNATGRTQRASSCRRPGG